MRRAVPLGPVEPLPWSALGAPGIEIKVLNEDPDTGGRTGILRSVARPAVEHKAQYHLGEEEFFCLGGRFTFDGETWFEPGSYVHFPPRTVHGARVQVPQGYLLYLRTAGDMTVHRVPEPLAPTPYSIAGPQRDGDTHTHVRTGGLEGPPARQPLRSGDGPDSRVELLRLSAGEALLPEGAASGSPALEVLVVSGTVSDGEGARIEAPAYGYYPAGRAPRDLRAVGPCVALVHAGPWP